MLMVIRGRCTPVCVRGRCVPRCRRIIVRAHEFNQPKLIQIYLLTKKVLHVYKR